MKKRLLTLILICVLLPLQMVHTQAFEKQSNSEFGKGNEIEEIDSDGLNNSPYNYSNYGHADWLNYFKTAGGLLVTAYNIDTNQLDIHTLSSTYDYKSKKSINLKMPIYGGLHLGNDGNFYILTGTENSEESQTKDVISIAKYDHNFNYIDEVIVKSNAANVFAGIVYPFTCGQSDMKIVNGILIVHTSRTMFVHADGLNHESNITFFVDTKTMELLNKQMPYVSHSFNQFIEKDGKNIFYVDHGDAYPRSVTMTAFYNFNTEDEYRREYDLFNITGRTGNNYTGTTVNAFEWGKQGGYVFGKSIPHNNPVQGTTGQNASDVKQNIYVILTDENGKKKEFKWLTNYHPINTSVYVGEPRVIKMSDQRYVVMFDEYINREHSLVYLLLDENANILVKRKYSNMKFNANSVPIYMNNEFVWIANDEEILDGTMRIYHIPYLQASKNDAVLNFDNVTIKPNETLDLQVSYSTNGAGNNHITWKSGNDKILSVSEKGRITANGIGTTYVYATTSNGITVKCLVKVSASDVVQPDKVTINTSKATLSIGKGFQAKATISPTSAVNKTVTWKSSSPTIASVDSKGNVKALKPGYTYIIATTANGKQAKCLVQVVDIKPNKVVMNLTSATLSVGKTFNARAIVYPTNAINKNVTYSSGNTNVLKVDSNGKVTTVGSGTTYVYAKTSNGITGKILVTVVPNPTSVAITPKSATVRIGATFKARGIVSPSNATSSVTFRSSSPSIATVDGSGNVKALKEGYTYISVTTVNGKTAKFLLRVVK